MPVKLKIVQVGGNSWGVRIPPKILELAGLERNDAVEVKVEDGRICIAKIKKKGQT